MTFTKTPPSNPGAYWWRQKPNQCAFLLERFKNGTAQMAGMGVIYNDAMLESGEWAGPLVSVEEVEAAWDEAWETALNGRTGWEESRARRVVNGEQV